MAARTIILPSAYFPPIPYFILVAGPAAALVELHETFPKQTLRNRCEIISASGRQKLIVPVTRPNGNHTLTKDILVNYRENWRRDHWRALMTSYNSSPYFDHYRERFDDFFRMNFSSLVAMNRYAFEMVCGMIGLQPSMGNTTEYFRPSGEEEDHRQYFSGKTAREFLTVKEYPQVFSHKFGFTADLSILDLLFNTGPETKERLVKPG